MIAAQAHVMGDWLRVGVLALGAFVIGSSATLAWMYVALARRYEPPRWMDMRARLLIRLGDCGLCLSFMVWAYLRLALPASWLAPSILASEAVLLAGVILTIRVDRKLLREHIIHGLPTPFVTHE